MEKKKTGEIRSPQALPVDQKNNRAKHNAEKDITRDADLSFHHKNDDLDEGELARLGGNKNDLT